MLFLREQAAEYSAEREAECVDLRAAFILEPAVSRADGSQPLLPRGRVLRAHGFPVPGDHGGKHGVPLCDQRVRDHANIRGRAADAVQRNAADGVSLVKQRPGKIVVKRRPLVEHRLVRQVILERFKDGRHSDSLPVRAERLQQLLRLAVYVPGTNGDDEVAFPGVLVEIQANLLKRRDIDGVMAHIVDGGDHIPRVHDAGVLFTPRVDVRHKHAIRVRKAGHVVAKQRTRARIAVTLKHAIELPVRNARCCIQRCADLVRVVAVIVINLDAVALAVKLKAAAGIAKLVQRACQHRKRNPVPVGKRRSRRAN